MFLHFVKQSIKGMSYMPGVNGNATQVDTYGQQKIENGHSNMEQPIEMQKPSNGDVMNMKPMEQNYTPG